MAEGVLNKSLDNLIDRRHGLQSGPVEIHRKRLYILPSGHGFTFAMALFIMLLWAINYSNSMGFALTFLLAAIALNTMWHTHRNLLGLRINPGPADPVFAGQNAYFHFALNVPDLQPRYGVGLQLRHATGSLCYTDIPQTGESTIRLAKTATRRGILHPGRIRLETRFPLGLFRAWSWVTFTHSCLVYPKPEGQHPLPKPISQGNIHGNAAVNALGSNDYSGLRDYIPGDSPRRIAWKSSTRDETVVVKQFNDNASPELWLDWSALPSLGTEQRLSQLCRWVLDADEQNYDYGLRLPTMELAPNWGIAHRQKCLRALALYDIDLETQNQS